MFVAQLDTAEDKLTMVIEIEIEVLMTRLCRHEYLTFIYLLVSTQNIYYKYIAQGTNLILK